MIVALDEINIFQEAKITNKRLKKEIKLVI